MTLWNGRKSVICAEKFQEKNLRFPGQAVVDSALAIETVITKQSNTLYLKIL